MQKNKKTPKNKPNTKQQTCLLLTGWRHLLSLENTGGLDLTSFFKPTGSGLLRCCNHPLRESVAISTTFTRQIIHSFSSQFSFAIVFFSPTIQLLWLCTPAVLSAACCVAFAPLYRFPLGCSRRKLHSVVCRCAAPSEQQVNLCKCCGRMARWHLTQIPCADPQ